MKNDLKNPLTRLLYLSIFGYGFSAVMLFDYFKNEKILWQLIIAITLVVFSTIFLIGRYIIIRKNNKKKKK